MWFIVRRAHLPGVNQTADITHDIHLVHSIAAYQTPLALNLVEGGRDGDEEGELGGKGREEEEGRGVEMGRGKGGAGWREGGEGKGEGGEKVGQKRKARRQEVHVAMVYQKRMTKIV